MPSAIVDMEILAKHMLCSFKKLPERAELMWSLVGAFPEYYY